MSPRPKKLPTFAEQMAAYDEAMRVYAIKMKEYERGERRSVPPYPVRPHTPGVVLPKTDDR